MKRGGDSSLLWAYSDTDAYTFERCELYTSDRMGHLRHDASEFIRDQLENLFGQFSEWFNLAEYPDVQEQLEPPERALFLKAAGAPEGEDLDSVENCFSGLCAVIRQRLEGPTIKDVQHATELFNWTIDFGLSSCDAQARAEIRAGTVREVAPFVIHRISSRLAESGRNRDARGPFAEHFLSLLPIVELLRDRVNSHDWTENDFAVEVFLAVAGLYKSVLAQEEGF